MEAPVETTVDHAAELAALKTAHSEVLAKRKRDKERIAELESGAASLQSKLTDAEARIHDLTISAPIKSMCENLSSAPEALQASLMADYSFGLQDGKLSLLSKDGKPVTQDGKVVPFERDALMKHLLSTPDVGKRRLYEAILIVSKASGGGSSSSTRGKQEQPAKRPTFGLR